MEDRYNPSLKKMIFGGRTEKSLKKMILFELVSAFL